MALGVVTSLFQEFKTNFVVLLIFFDADS